MSGPVTFHVPENKLGKLLRAPGGKPVVEAVAEASQGLEKLQDDILADLDRMLGEAEAIAGRCGSAFNAEPAAALYETVSAAIGVATASGLGSIDAALISLSNLLDAFIARQSWDAEPVAVHLQSVKLLRFTPVGKDAAGAQAVLEGLRQVNARFAKPASAGSTPA